MFLLLLVGSLMLRVCSTTFLHTAISCKHIILFVPAKVESKALATSSMLLQKAAQLQSWHYSPLYLTPSVIFNTDKSNMEDCRQFKARTGSTFSKERQRIKDVSKCFLTFKNIHQRVISQTAKM